jgi:hypothetical protein
VEEDFRIKSSALADLGPLPEVVESNSDTVWQAFLQLEGSSRGTSRFGALRGSQQPRRRIGEVALEDVMALARRFNRICPVESEWLRLQAALADCGGAEAPDVVQGAAFRRMRPLARRMALRDVVEWAAERGFLIDVYGFLEALPENRWTHMGE